jgi:hypothetical protein
MEKHIFSAVLTFFITVVIVVKSQQLLLPYGNVLQGRGALLAQYQGFSVALNSLTSDTMAVGGPYDNSGGIAGIGGVWIFTRAAASTWYQQGSPLVGNSNSTDQNQNQGYSVALSADGNLLASGAPGNNKGKGGVWIFTRDDIGRWSQQSQKPIVGTLSNDLDSKYYEGQGYSVALSSAGDILTTGSRNTVDCHAVVHIFNYKQGIWSQQGLFFVGSSDDTQDFGGCFVSISADGRTLAVGAVFDSYFRGAAYIFVRSGVTWSQQSGKLILSNNFHSYANFAYTLSLSADGNTLAVSHHWGASIFIRNGITWQEQDSHTISTTVIEWEITRVSLSADGNTLCMGVPGDNHFTGSVLIFVRSGSSWSQQGSKLIGVGNYHGQGFSVAISSAGDMCIIGGPFTSSYGRGGVWVFSRNQMTWTQQIAELTGAENGFATPAYGSAIAMSANGNTIAIGAPNDGGDVGAVWIFTNNGNFWTQQGSKLVGTETTGYFPLQGSAVAISGDGNTIASGGPRDAENVGAVWIFVRKQGGTYWTQQGTKLVGSVTKDSSFDQYQGNFLALNFDGNTLASSAPWVDLSGAVFIFVRKDGQWSQQAMLTVKSNYYYINVGCVALSSDGNTLAIGDEFYYTDVIFPPKSGIKIFFRQNGQWSQQQARLLSPGIIAHTVSLTSDGNTLAVGGIYNTSVNNGVFWVFERNQSGIWSQQTENPILYQALQSGSFPQTVIKLTMMISSFGNVIMISTSHGQIGFFRNGVQWLQHPEYSFGIGNTFAMDSNATIFIDGIPSLFTDVNVNGKIMTLQTGGAQIYTFQKKTGSPTFPKSSTSHPSTFPPSNNNICSNNKCSPKNLNEKCCEHCKDMACQSGLICKKRQNHKNPTCQKIDSTPSPVTSVDLCASCTSSTKNQPCCKKCKESACKPGLKCKSPGNESIGVCKSK